MTPPRLDVDACQEKLALLADLVADLDRHLDVTGSGLRADRDRRHVVERILTQLVDIAGSLNSLLARGLGHRAPTGHRDGFELLRDLGLHPQELVDRLLPSVGMHNLLTHQYGPIDLDLVAAATPAARRDYASYVEVVRDVLRDSRRGSSSPPSASDSSA
jgi:uncharacterized protein YutE (UPF0331/DUF86 family)